MSGKKSPKPADTTPPRPYWTLKGTLDKRVAATAGHVARQVRAERDVLLALAEGLSYDEQERNWWVAHCLKSTKPGQPLSFLERKTGMSARQLRRILHRHLNSDAPLFEARPGNFNRDGKTGVRGPDGKLRRCWTFWLARDPVALGNARVRGADGVLRQGWTAWLVDPQKHQAAARKAIAAGQLLADARPAPSEAIPVPQIQKADTRTRVVPFRAPGNPVPQKQKATSPATTAPTFLSPAPGDILTPSTDLGFDQKQDHPRTPTASDPKGSPRPAADPGGVRASRGWHARHAKNKAAKRRRRAPAPNPTADTWAAISKRAEHRTWERQSYLDVPSEVTINVAARIVTMRPTDPEAAALVEHIGRHYATALNAAVVDVLGVGWTVRITTALDDIRHQETSHARTLAAQSPEAWTVSAAAAGGA